MTVAPGSNPIVAVGKVRFGNAQPLALIAGPCALESRDHAFEMASALKEITARIGIGFVYKTSFDKANRTSARSNRGIGLEAALPIFADIRQKIGVPILTDVHDVQQCARGRSRGRAANPAFLCRQTDLIVAAATTGRAINVKKGQFLAPWDMANVVAKVTAAGNPNVLVTERGASFGYNTLSGHARAADLARSTGAPVIFDATHSVQQPGGQEPLRRRAGIRAGAGTRGGRSWRRRRLHRNPPGPRQSAVRRPQHAAAQADGRPSAPPHRVRQAR